MKSSLFILICLITNINVFAQPEIIANYNSCSSGRNISLGLKENIKKHSLYLSFKYNINSLVHDNQNNVFRKRFFATNTFENFAGIDFGYIYTFNLKNTTLKPLIFYDLLLTHSHTRNVMYLPYSITNENEILYKKHLVYFGPMQAWENDIGIGFSIKITPNMQLYEKTGIGILFIGNKDKRMVGPNWDHAYLLSIGLGYQFAKESKK